MIKVVLVDDDPIILEELRCSIPWEQYDCFVAGSASSGSEGRDLILKIKPDILFTDVQMPGMDGLVMLAGLRSEMPEMQVMVLSGYRDFEYAQTAMLLGVSRFLTKPLQMDELHEALEFMCRRAKKLSADEAVSDADSGEHAGSFLVKNALKHIEEHYNEKLTLTNVAESTYVSQWHLSKLLNKHSGQSFSEILNGVRIKNAKKFLHNPSLRIREISEMTGFSDVSHFSRIFKKIEGVSPNEYRNSSRN